MFIVRPKQHRHDDTCEIKTEQKHTKGTRDSDGKTRKYGRIGTVQVVFDKLSVMDQMSKN